MKRAFTIIELIIVITILAILGTISFLSFQNYAIEARDVKRISDTRSLISKIVLESTIGKDFSDLIDVKEIKDIRINKNPKEKTNIGIVNFVNLKELQKNFQDPLNKVDYPAAYSTSGTGSGAYSFVQIATVSEKEKVARLFGNYYKMDFGDAASLFIIGTGVILEDGGNILPYPIDKGSNGDQDTNIYSCKNPNNIVFENIITKNTEGLTEETKDTEYQTTNPDGLCYYECKKGYILESNKCIENINGVNVWTDPNTGIKWQLDVSGKYKWDDAKAFCADLGLGWKLPTKNELFTLTTYDVTNGNNAYTLHPNMINDIYLSSTVYSPNPTVAVWSVKFNNGDIHSSDYDNPYNIVCVYDGERDNWIKNPDTAFDIRFNDSIDLDGELAYYDKYINKYWQANINGKYTLEGANTYCTNLGTGGWRLPTKNELYTLATDTIKNKYGAYTAHPNIILGDNKGIYWVSTPYYPNMDIYYYWDVRFINGDLGANKEDTTLLVICIHDK